MSPLVYLLAAIGTTALLFCGALAAFSLIEWWRDRHRDLEAELRLRRHAERQAADNGRPQADVTVTPRRGS